MNAFYANTVGVGWLGRGEGFIHSSQAGQLNYTQFVDYENGVITIPPPAFEQTLLVTPTRPQVVDDTVLARSTVIYKITFNRTDRDLSGTVSVTVSNQGLLYFSMVAVGPNGERKVIKVSTSSDHPKTSYPFIVNLRKNPYLLVFITAGDVPGEENGIEYTFNATVNS